MECTGELSQGGGVLSFRSLFTLHAQSLHCPTVGDPMDPSPPGFSVHGILQARILEWVAMFSSGGSSGSRNSKLCLPQLLHCRGILHRWATGELVVHQLPWRPSGKESPCNAGDAGSTPGSGRSPGEGNGNPLQDSCLGNPVDRGAWQARVCGIAKESDMTEQLNNTKDWLRISCYLKKNHACSLSRKAPVKKPNSVALCYAKETSGPGSCLNTGTVRRLLLEGEVVAWVLKLAEISC